MRDQPSILVSESIADKIDIGQFYGGSETECNMECHFFFADEMHSFPVFKIKREFTHSQLEIDFPIKTEKIGIFLSNRKIKDVHIVAGGHNEHSRNILMIKNSRIISFESSIYNEDSHICKLIIYSPNI